MRIVTYGAACSLDGFIADADGGVEWLHMSRDAQAIMAEYWATIDTLVWGRKTWDMAAAMGGGGSGGRAPREETPCQVERHQIAGHHQHKPNDGQ